MHKALNTQLNSHQESISEHSVNNRMAGVSDRFLFLFLFLFFFSRKHWLFARSLSFFSSQICKSYDTPKEA